MIPVDTTCTSARAGKPRASGDDPKLSVTSDFII